MAISIDVRVLRKKREKRCWTQEDLADASSISLRTIQRIENDGLVSLSSLAALASAFGDDATVLRSEIEDNGARARERKSIRDYLNFKMSFWIHLVTYVFVIGLLLAINLSDRGRGLWVTWPAIGWGIGVFAHGATVFLLGTIGKVEEKIRGLEA